MGLESARRRAFFEWTIDDIRQVAGDCQSIDKQVGGDSQALDLARGQHLRLFRDLPGADGEKSAEICRRLCLGISRLEDLPPKASDRTDVVPLRVTPRTPTETAFWVEKPLVSFMLKPDLPAAVDGVERLHRQAILIYSYRRGREERLQLGAELFHLLLELADGYQLGDISTDDTFANLSIFVQRLVQEDARELFAWNPMADETIYRVAAEFRDTTNGPQQRLILAPLTSGTDK